MNKRNWLTLSMGVTLLCVLALPASAMHIAEGYLPPLWALGWGACALPFLVAGFFSLKKRLEKSEKAMIMLALCGAFAFVLSALKIPSVTGSCSHPTGVGLGAILFGPLATGLLALIVLLFQALLLAHGGVTTLGANVFSMGIVGPFVSFFIYKLSRKMGLKTGISVFLAACLGNLLTYVCTSVQLAMVYPENGSVVASLVKFLTIFALTQIPLAVCEGLVTVVIFGSIEKYSGRTLTELEVA